MRCGKQGDSHPWCLPQTTALYQLQKTALHETRDRERPTSASTSGDSVTRTGSAAHINVHGKRQSRSSVVASAAGQLNGLLFIVDDNSAKRFLVDTGTSVSVFSATHKDIHSGVRMHSIVAATGTNIATHGTREMSLSIDRCNYW